MGEEKSKSKQSLTSVSSTRNVDIDGFVGLTVERFEFGLHVSRAILIVHSSGIISKTN